MLQSHTKVLWHCDTLQQYFVIDAVWGLHINIDCNPSLHLLLSTIGRTMASLIECIILIYLQVVKMIYGL